MNLSAWRYYAPNAAAETHIVATISWVDTRASQLQSVRIAATACGRRPIVAVAAPITRRRPNEVAGVEEIVRVTSKDFGHLYRSRSRTRTCFFNDTATTEIYT